MVARTRCGSAPRTSTSTVKSSATVEPSRECGSGYTYWRHEPRGATTCVYAILIVRAPFAGIGKTLSWKRPPRCQSRSAGSRHGPCTQMMSESGRFTGCGAALSITPWKILPARTLSTKAPSSKPSFTSSAS